MAALDLNRLKVDDQRLTKRLEAEYIDASKQSEVIFDGLVNPDHYAESSPRILWFLKEPYCDGNACTGGGWSLVGEIEKDTDSWARQRTFQPICYINYGIWKGESDWDNMPWLRDNEEMRMWLKRIAFINVSKLPGLKWSPSDRIYNAYQNHRQLLLDQIQCYAPNLIFACDPHANELLKDFGYSESDWESFGNAASIQLSTEQRLIWVAHPASRTKRLEYVNNAIRAATAILPSSAYNRRIERATQASNRSSASL